MVWDKTKPAGTTPLKLSDDQLRDNQAALETAFDQDHDFTTGSTQTGKHDKVTIKVPLVTKPTLLADEGALYTKTVSGKSELFFEDEDGHEVQLTSGGYINSTILGLTSTIAQLNYIGSSSVSEADLIKLHAITISAATINALVTTARTITAGTGLTGGGTLAADRTISVATGGIDTTQLADGAVTAIKIENGVVSGAKLTALTAGDYVELASPSEYTRDMSVLYSAVALWTAYCPRAGTVRVRWQHKRTSGTGTVYTRVYKNGVAVGTSKSTTSSSYASVSEDVAVAAGDEIAIYMWGSAAGPFGAMNCPAICTGAPLLSTMTWANWLAYEG